ncbi:DNA polymerase beta domain protein region [Allomuricauda ruestringensis DSM 13258]|uniref:DNA polymerase beta domain protein region n=1 Tax=Allomuricauda ruestringensis (strain DSM 13258 / CIP 107369 / LMG 19739 / B1) TaxID=886377 RepID=G2PQK1_ALLRU|nr:nucleotidyltransferase family protein [Allomuricauda ruestringensis]AEM70596.1 DNA polymerase beta domain protein region [Allomuricauda ruestringensis DSM 13258]
METTQNIANKLSKLKVRLKERYPISSMALFGSYARNEQTDTSDVDIMVEFDGKIGIRFIDLANEIEKALGLKVDLVSKKGIKEQYLNTILSDLIYV